MLPGHVIAAIESGLRGEPLVPAGTLATVTRSVPHCHVAAVWAQTRRLGLPALLGPTGRQRDLSMALIIARVVRPRSKLAITCWWADTSLGADIVVAASTDEVCMRRWTGCWAASPGSKTVSRGGIWPARRTRRGMALFDLSSSWMEGSHCPLARWGYSRDGKKDRPQIEYGLLTDRERRPVAVEVFPGNTADPAAFTHAVQLVQERFKLTDLVLVGDRGMITTPGSPRSAARPGWAG